MPYGYDGHLLDDIPLFALEWDDFWSHMCALDPESEAPKYSQRSDHKQFVRAYAIHWETLEALILLPKAAKLSLPFACSSEEHTYSSWLALALEENSPRFGAKFSHLLLGICNVSRQMRDKTCTRSSLPADFRHVLKRSQYLWRGSAPFHHHALDQLRYSVLYGYAEIDSFINFVWASRYVPLSLEWASIKVPMKCAALPPSVHHISEVVSLRTRVVDFRVSSI